MKKCLALLLAMLLLLQLGGCSMNELMRSDSNKIDEMSEKIIRCLIEKDRETLGNLFCERVKKTAEFDAQMNALFAFCDYAHCIRYDLGGDHAQSEASEFGVRTEWSVDAEIIYIDVSDEKGTLFYGVEYQWTPIYEANAELVGLHALTVHLLNTDNSVTLGSEKDFPF